MTKKSSDQMAASHFFLSSVFLSLTIGVPFCLFKFLFGVLAIREGTESGAEWLIMFGWGAITLAAIDLAMNLIRSAFELANKKALIEFCLIAQLGRIFRRQSLFLTFDTFLSFTIICFVLWSGWIVELKGHETYLWYGATTINLISLAIVNLWNEFRTNSDSY